MKIVELFVAKDGRYFEDQDACVLYETTLPVGEQPYIYKGLNSQKKEYNPKFDSDAVCECGHAYYRHFDSYENNEPVGCKYCSCYHFTLAKKEHNHNCSEKDCHD